MWFFHRDRKAQSIAVFARGEAKEQHGSVKRAVRNTPKRLPVEAINQLLPDLASPGGGVSAAREQRQQVGGTRRLHVAVRLHLLQAEPRRGDESRKPPHNVWRVHQIAQHRPCGRLQRIALKQGDGESCEIAVEDNELATAAILCAKRAVMLYDLE